MVAFAADIVIFGGNSNRNLVEKICHYLEIPLGNANISQFSDGETRIELQQNVRGKDVFVIQSTCRPANHHVMEALLIVDAAKRASAQSITLVSPYFGYARQERKHAPRTSIAAKLVASLFETAGIHRLLTMELHNPAIQGFFNCPVDHLFAKLVFKDAFLELDHSQCVVISPDAGGVERARAFAKVLNCGLAIIDKRRTSPNESMVMNIIGEVVAKNCIILDDLIDTGGSLTNAAVALKKAGAKSVNAAVTHAVLSPGSLEKIQNSPLKKIVVTDTIPLSPEASQCEKISQVSIAKLFAEAILRIQSKDSISSLFL